VARTEPVGRSTSPPSPLSFRTSGFPQYGCKAGSSGAYPRVLRSSLLPAYPSHATVCLHPPCAWRDAKTPRTVSESAAPPAPPRARSLALPQGPSLRSGLCCPRPSSLTRPHPPHSPAPRDFAAPRLLRAALPRRERLGRPRVVPCFRCPFRPDMSPSSTPGSPPAARAQFLHRRHWPSPVGERLGTPK
jgi:hypothetical protein